jgi:hypothetical protein
MLGDSKAFSSFSVDDMQKAKTFYGQTSVWRFPRFPRCRAC